MKTQPGAAAVHGCFSFCPTVLTSCAMIRSVMAKAGSQVVASLKLTSTMLLLFLFPAAWLSAQVPEGIPRDMARQRAQQISDVRYHLSYTLTPHAPSVAGHEEIQFRLQSLAAVMLDFREGTVADA